MKARRTGTVHHIVDARTAAVHVDRQVRHPKYGKSYRRTTKLLVDVAPTLELTAGAVVVIEAVRPISKCKSWRVIEIVKAGAGAPVAIIDELAEASLGMESPSTRLRSEATAGQAGSGQSPEEIA